MKIHAVVTIYEAWKKLKHDIYRKAGMYTKAYDLLKWSSGRLLTI